jgi:Domain of unknown function (DUF4430)
MFFASGVISRLGTGMLVLAWAGLVLGAGALGGCGLGARTAPGPVSLTVTRDFGARVVHVWSVPAPRGQTALSLLTRHATVAQGNGFVQSIDGLPGGEASSGRRARWFLYVNGVAISKAAAMTGVHPADRIWWDLHAAGPAAAVPAVVGSFPEPFLHGIEGKRLPVRVECAGVSSRPCQTVESRLQGLGVPAALAAIGPGVEPETLRVAIGPWSAIRGAPAAQAIEQGPRASGVFARFSAGGNALLILNEQGQTARVLTGAGLIAATRSAEQAPVWLVSGTDEAGVQLAARALALPLLAHRFAVALTQGGATLTAPLP